MKRISEYHPLAVTFYFLAVTLVAMFNTHPVITLLSLTGAVLLFLIRNGTRHGTSHLYFLGLFLLMALANPLVSHHGVTVLLVIDHKPVTLEALLYGFSASASVSSVLYWFRSFSQIMTRDKLLCVFGTLSPKLALVLSMAIRYTDLIAVQSRKVMQAQKALGLYREDHILARCRGGLRVFSVMLTWVLENGIITSDSMAARGYGIGKRTQFSIHRFRRADLLLVLASAILCIVVCIGMVSDHLAFQFYPSIHAASGGAMQYCCFAAYGLLVGLPAILEGKERIKWNYYLSKI